MKSETISCIVIFDLSEKFLIDFNGGQGIVIKKKRN